MGSADERLPLPLGSVLAGKYRLDTVIGASGMGVVYGATHTEMERGVAVKFLLPRQGPSADEVVERFRREAKFMAKIRSEHVVRVFDVGRSDAGAPYIVMEKLEGHDLDRLVATRGRIPVAEAVDYVLQACAGLADAHAAGVLHRDIKPSNLFLSSQTDGKQVVKLIDFGVAKFRGPQEGLGAEEEAALTKTEVLVGTPRYMAPEQLRSSRDVDARADVWSLGVILAEFLHGGPLIEAHRISDLIVRILTSNAPRLDEMHPDIPKGLADAIAAALAREPADRTPSVAAFARALLPFVSAGRRAALEPLVLRGADTPVAPPEDSAPVARVPTATPSSPSVGTSDSSEQGLPNAAIAQRRRARRVVAALMLICLGGIGVAWLRSNGSDDTGTSTHGVTPAAIPSSAPPAASTAPEGSAAPIPRAPESPATSAAKVETRAPVLVPSAIASAAPSPTPASSGPPTQPTDKPPAPRPDYTQERKAGLFDDLR
jgi:serine/threonine protein kinase